MVPFVTASPDIDESPLENEKAREIAKTHKNHLIIGSDQVALHGTEIVGKPHSHERAVEQLKTASGKKITLYTGLALLNSNTGELQSERRQCKVGRPRRCSA